MKARFVDHSCLAEPHCRNLKLFPQMVQPIANPVHLCVCVTSLSNVHSLFNEQMPFFQIIERIDFSR